MAELEKISISGFKSIKKIERLRLGSLNVLIGANGSGKSNFIGVFSFLRELKEGRLQDFVRRNGGADRVLYFGSKVTDKIELHLEFSEGVNQYKIVLAPTENGLLYPSYEVVYFWDKTKYPKPYDKSLIPNLGEAGISSANGPAIAQYVREHFDRWRTYHFHDTSAASPLKKPAKVSDNRYLRADGSNLAAFLYLLRTKHVESYQMIRAAVQRVFPVFDDFDLEPSRLNNEFISLEWKHRNSDTFFDVASFSDGTLRFVALATLFLQPAELRPSVVLVDEPELGLHPFAIGVLAALVKQASLKTQVILSTQSPILLDHFSPEDVIVANLVGGATELSRIDSAALAEWLDDYSLGQLWEKNEIGGRPSRATPA